MIDLFNHQKIALSYLRTNDFFALFMEAGTSKTYPTLIRILELLKSGKIDDALIVAPKSTLGAWSRDLDFFDPSDREILESAITVINYDKVWRKGNKSPYYRAWGAIVLDESHNIKNRTSQRAKFCLELSTMSRYKYILTGTPISNGALEDIFAQLTFLSPYIERGRVYSRIFKNHLERMSPGKTFRGSYYEFLDRYCILNKYHKPYKYINVRELQNLINEYSYRVKKSECLDLPEKLPDEIITVENMEKTLYKKLSTSSALLEYEILAENPLSRMVKLRQLASGFIKNESDLYEFKCEKLSILQEIIERYEDDKKLVIFAEFKYSIRKISDMLVKMGIKYVVLDGDQKNKTIWRDFQRDNSIRVIVCQYQTANAGIDLFSSDTIIYYEPTLRSTVLEQSRDRIHRSGQKNKCSYIHLLTKGTVEEAIYKALSGYADFSERLFTEYLASYQKSYSK
jgi:SNF2 family DNA or RNA helicase